MFGFCQKNVNALCLFWCRLYLNICKYFTNSCLNLTILMNHYFTLLHRCAAPIFICASYACCNNNITSIRFNMRFSDRWATMYFRKLCWLSPTCTLQHMFLYTAYLLVKMDVFAIIRNPTVLHARTYYRVIYLKHETRTDIHCFIVNDSDVLLLRFSHG